MMALGTAAVTFTSEMVGQNARSKAMKRYNAELYRNTVTNLTFKNRGLHAQQAQAEDAYAAKRLNAQIIGAKARGASIAGASDSGGGGNSMAAIGQALDNEIARNMAVLGDNLTKTRAQTASQVAFSQENANAYLRTNRQDTSINYLGSAMRAITAGVSVYNSGGGFDGILSSLNKAADTAGKQSGGANLQINKGAEQ